jgi:hypothetical protein
MADPAPVLRREVDALIHTQITILNQARPFLRDCSTPKEEFAMSICYVTPAGDDSRATAIASE